MCNLGTNKILSAIAVRRPQIQVRLSKLFVIVNLSIYQFINHINTYLFPTQHECMGAAIRIFLAFAVKKNNSGNIAQCFHSPVAHVVKLSPSLPNCHCDGKHEKFIHLEPFSRCGSIMQSVLMNDHPYLSFPLNCLFGFQEEQENNIWPLSVRDCGR